MATEREKLIFDNLDCSGENSEKTDLDVNTFFDLMEDMVRSRCRTLTEYDRRGYTTRII